MMKQYIENIHMPGTVFDIDISYCIIQSKKYQLFNILRQSKILFHNIYYRFFTTLHD